jgi:hypothetical protein
MLILTLALESKQILELERDRERYIYKYSYFLDNQPANKIKDKIENLFI